MHNQRKNLNLVLSLSSTQNKVQRYIFNVVTHTRFELAILLLIGVNMITLSFDHYQMSAEWENMTKYIDITFTTIFGLEAVFKLIGMRYHYFRDAFNVFDFIVVIISTAGE